jgi:hypothetical protein
MTCLTCSVFPGDTLAQYVRDTCCPFTRREVLVTLPVVSLSITQNRLLFEQLIMHAFMDGVFPRAAWLCFFAIASEMAIAHRGDDNSPWQYFVDQVL